MLGLLGLSFLGQRLGGLKLLGHGESAMLVLRDMAIFNNFFQRLVEVVFSDRYPIIADEGK